MSVLEMVSPLWHIGWAGGKRATMGDDGTGEVLQMARTPFGWGEGREETINEDSEKVDKSVGMTTTEEENKHGLDGSFLIMCKGARIEWYRGSSKVEVGFSCCLGSCKQPAWIGSRRVDVVWGENGNFEHNRL